MGPSGRRRLTQEVIQAYAEASGDHNPIHLDDDYARAAGLPSTIAHGLLTLGTVCAAVERWSQGAQVSRVSCRFSAPVPSGGEVVWSSLETRAAEGWRTVELEVLTADGERALTKARVQFRAG